MSPGVRPVPGILVAHGGLAAELKATAESIAGAAPDLVVLSNAGLAPEGLAEQIAAVLDARGPGVVVLVDLAGGSCLAAAMRAARGRPGVTIVAGVNLPLLLDFIQKSGQMDAGPLVEHLLERGHAGLKRLDAGSPG